MLMHLPRGVMLSIFEINPCHGECCLKVWMLVRYEMRDRANMCELCQNRPTACIFKHTMKKAFQAADWDACNVTSENRRSAEVSWGTHPPEPPIMTFGGLVLPPPPPPPPKPPGLGLVPSVSAPLLPPVNPVPSGFPDPPPCSENGLCEGIWEPPCLTDGIRIYSSMLVRCLNNIGGASPHQPREDRLCCHQPHL